MIEKISVIIPIQSESTLQTNSSDCPFNCELIVVRSFGIGRARSIGASVATGDLIVMLDSDLVISPSLWSWLFTLRKGSFAMTKNSDRISYSSRVFAMHKDDYLKVGGFDSSLKYLWEDGEFALRASALGLKVTPVPSSMYQHIEHQRRFQDKKFLVPFNWEYARLYVKFNRKIYPNLIMWFFDGFNLRKRQFNLRPATVRVCGFFFWNLRSFISSR